MEPDERVEYLKRTRKGLAERRVQRHLNVEEAHDGQEQAVLRELRKYRVLAIVEGACSEDPPHGGVGEWPANFLTELILDAIEEVDSDI